VHVVEYQDQRPAGGQLLDQRSERAMVSIALGAGTCLRFSESPQRREHAGEMRKMLPESLEATRLERAQEVIQCLDQGGEWHLPLELGTSRGQDRVTAPGGTRPELSKQPGLTDTGLPENASTRHAPSLTSRNAPSI
jgi:hypothetical protein